MYGRWTGINDHVAIINVYGPHNKEELWNSIFEFMSNKNAIWIIFGDFNEVRFKEERAGTNFVAREAIILYQEQGFMTSIRGAVNLRDLACRV